MIYPLTPTIWMYTIGVPMTTETQRRLARSKESERKLGRFLLEHDGPDPRWRPGGGLSSSTGRVGHITELQLDVISLHYGAENKQMIVPGILWGFWKKVVQRANEQGKTPLLRWEPTNEDKYVEGVKIPPMHIISEARHAELLGYERAHHEKIAALTTVSGGVRAYSKEDQLKRSRGRKVK